MTLSESDLLLMQVFGATGTLFLYGARLALGSARGAPRARDVREAGASRRVSGPTADRKVGENGYSPVWLIRGCSWSHGIGARRSPDANSRRPEKPALAPWCTYPVRPRGWRSGRERALRHAVCWQRMTYGTDSPDGSRFVERVLTTVAT